VLFGGDLYEHERFSPDTGQFLRAMFEGIHPTPVYISPGNHDWPSTETASPGRWFLTLCSRRSSPGTAASSGR
jgi:DNA repair exonuclease SbcCD nuclease subunit